MRHEDAETRIPYVIGRDGDFAKPTLIVSCDSDFTAISTLNTKLRHKQIIHRVSDYYMYIDAFLNALDTIGISSCLVTSAFATGGCDFNTLIKHITIHFFVVVIVERRDLRSLLLRHSMMDSTQQRGEWTPLFTSLIIYLAYLEHHNRMGAYSSPSITRSPQLP